MTDRLAGGEVEQGRAARAFRPVDSASLVAFRFFFGLMMAFGTLRYLSLGWMRAQYVEPRIHLKYPGFEWVPVPPEWGLLLLFGSLFVLSLLLAIGWRARLTAPLFLVAFVWVQLMDVTNYLNHYWLVAALALLLCFLPLERDTVPAWCLWLVRAQVGLVYFHAALAKVEPDWLLHGQPLGIWLASREETPLLGPLFGLPYAALAMSWAGFLFDLTIVFWLSWKRTRLPAYLVLVVFHVLTRVLFPIGMFPAIMIVSALVFFPPDWPRRFMSFAPRAALAPPRRAWAAIAAVWIAFQALVPLRHCLYPGTVLWNEEGMRFAWKVMVREKAGSVTYYVRDPRSGREWIVSPTDLLTWRQAREMSTQPDLIAQVARRIEDDFRARGYDDVEVRADALVSLNGRPAVRMIDRAVDLTEVRWGFARADWVLPEPEGPPLPSRRRAVSSLVGGGIR